MSTGRSALFPGKQFISTVLEALETKTQMTGQMRQRYLQRAMMAGFIIGLLYMTNYSLVQLFDTLSFGGTSLRPIGRIAGALAFGWALVFIYYTKSELLTSNMMIVTIGAYHHRTGWWRAFRILSMCLVGNFLGGLTIALILRASTLTSGPTLVELQTAVSHKLAFITSGPGGWVDLLMRALLCNFMINLAMLLVYNGVIRDDLTRSLTMITSVFIFAFLGFEHSVANTVLFTIVGLHGGLDVAAALGNVLVCLIGNYIGGGLMIGLYYAYLNDDRRFLDHGEES
ncbi:formate/nitrite transporter family protein [Arsenicicoccus piscis]|uniref:Formate/nitrite transporter family protein n=1 Tax=Arsenicicoccus piscis TaxID=673954 RepID=A0ABQ6HSP5_9MICO|nr:formate/nitrite transporter family protein [Arsenicicoccus piscis]MCH8627939.1 formate/nitrite transporter family protein [Arsenicicoccus piscis]GMA20729.1 formate/nitrite transporter family protein [Arsenicicoccus piscis]